MNEYDRLYRQAQRYREMYPEGTRILLLHMGDDPRPVEDDMRGTVKYVDDTVWCSSRSTAASPMPSYTDNTIKYSTRMP